MSDGALVFGIARPRTDALGEAYRRHADTAVGLAVGLLHDRSLAEDVVQEVFLRLWNEPDLFDPARGSLVSFLMVTVHNRAVDLLRAESSRHSREVRRHRMHPAEIYDLEGEIVELTIAEHVRDALGRLSDDQRDAIELAYFGGHTYRMVAELLGVPEGTIKTRIRVGLRRLRDELVKSGITSASGDS